VTTASSSLSRPWDLRGVSLMTFAHGASDLYSGILPFVIFFDVTPAVWRPGVRARWRSHCTSPARIAQPLVDGYRDRRRALEVLAGLGRAQGGRGLGDGGRDLAADAGGFVVLGGFGWAVMHPEAGRFSSLLGGSKCTSAISIFQIGGQIGYGIGPLVAAALPALSADRA